jgi:hypothetical protein
MVLKKKYSELNTVTPPPNRMRPQIIQSVSGKGNVVVGRDFEHSHKTCLYAKRCPLQIRWKTYCKHDSTKNPGTGEGIYRSPSCGRKRYPCVLRKELEQSKEQIQRDPPIRKFSSGFRPSDSMAFMLRSRMAMPKIRRKDPEKWKGTPFQIDLFARGRAWDFQRMDLYLLAQERLALKKPVNSLKELTQRDLQRLDNI